MPEFEDEEGPDAVAVVPDFGFVFGDEAADFGGVKIAEVESAVVQRGVVGHDAAFVAWDQTSGVNGGVASVGTRGGTKAFSTLYDYASLSVGTV